MSNSLKYSHIRSFPPTTPIPPIDSPHYALRIPHYALLKNFRNLFHLLGLVAESLGIFLILGGESKLFHKPIDLYMASTLETSSGP